MPLLAGVNSWRGGYITPFTEISEKQFTKIGEKQFREKGAGMDIEEAIGKRKRIWKGDIEADRKYVEIMAYEAISNREWRDAIRERPDLLIEGCFTIVDKMQRTVPFFLNEVQREFMKGFKLGGEYFILKGRQQGFTSLITALQLACSITRKNFSGFTVADVYDNVVSIFTDKAKMVFNRLPEILKPHEKYNTRTELFFDNMNSSWRVATASGSLGRSRTLNFVHFSEVAYYECDLGELQKGIGQALTTDATVIYETTANGYNSAKELWDRKTCKNMFFEWWKTAEYVSDLEQEVEDKWIVERKRWLQTKGLDNAQINWYIGKYKSFLDPDAIRQEYPCTPEEAFIASGLSEFGNDILLERIDEAKQRTWKKGYFIYKKQQVDIDVTEITDIEFVEDEVGYLTIHKEPVKETIDGVIEMHPYSIGADPAGEGSDFFAAKVVDNITQECVATLHIQGIEEDLFADQLYCLGRMYHDALIGIEVNTSTVSTRELEKLKYPSMYVRERMDVITGRMVNAFGFKTTTSTRPVIIAELKRLFRENPFIEPDAKTLYEMLYFVRNDKGKTEAIRGKHDDLVMASAIAHFVSHQGRKTKIQIKPREIKLSDLFNLNVAGQGEFIQW